MKRREKEEKRQEFGWHALKHLLEAAALSSGAPETGTERSGQLWQQLHQDNILQYDGFKQGTVLRKQWHGQWHQLIVTSNGFLYEGRIFKTLSAVANHITGGQRNGKEFFGVNHGN